MIKIGIIGGGMRGRLYATELFTIREVEIVGVVDHKLSKESWQNVTRYTSFEEMYV